MNRITKTMAKTIAALGFLAASAFAFAQQDEYVTVPKGDPQYLQCLSRVNKLYEGGDERSPSKGKTRHKRIALASGTKRPMISKAICLSLPIALRVHRLTVCA